MVQPPAGNRPTFTGSLPMTPADQDKNAAAPEKTTLPVGVGLTTGPKSFLIGATLDFPIDKQITIGPSLEHGFDNNMSLNALTGQLKYFLPASGDGSEGGMSLLPYLTVGVGMATIDKEGQSSDSGLLINGGAGVRFLTGEHYRIGSEARVNFLPSKLDGERGYLSFELLQIVISF